MSDKLIKASDAVDIVAKHSSLYGDGEINTDDGEALLYDIMSEIMNLPSAEPQPKTGQWLPDNTNYYDERYICSRCGCNYKVGMCMGKPMWNFCPNCGSYNGGDSDVKQ